MEEGFRRLYERLGHRYMTAYRVVFLSSAIGFALLGAGILHRYSNIPTDELLRTLAFAVAAMLGCLGWATVLWTRAGEPLERWLREGRPTEGALAAWEAAVRLPSSGLRITVWRAIVFCGVPISAFVTWELELAPESAVVLLASILAVATWPTVLNYFALGVYVRPVLRDISRQLPRGFEPPEGSLTSLGSKLLVTLPAIGVISGIFGTVISSGSRTSLVQLGADVLFAAAVALTFSLLLALLVTRSLVAPIEDLTAATRRVRAGDLDSRVPVASGDELGALAASFNEMLERLGERELLHRALDSYAAPDVARRVVAERTPELSAVEIEVTMLFVDVCDFTSYSERATPEQAIAYLNRFFDVAVRVVQAHGGHTNKIQADGLLAVFGAPEPANDHADRGLRAALELVERLAAEAGEELRVGAGLNTGTVLAGAVGGGGRYEFMLIGDPVNVAARVERHTRETGDRVLLTDATAGLLRDERLRARLEPRGDVLVKGKTRPVRVFAARTSRAQAHAATGAGLARGLDG